MCEHVTHIYDLRERLAKNISNVLFLVIRMAINLIVSLFYVLYFPLFYCQFFLICEINF